MREAKFIVQKEEDNKFLCNICSEEIDKDKIIALKCNPTKHIFCYDCIFDWYKEVSKNKNTHYQNYSKKNMCPICRENGGLLPLCNKYKFTKGIHYIKIENTINICNAKLKNGKGLCKYKSCNIDGNTFCKLHKDLWNTTPIVDNNISLLDNIPLVHESLNPNKLTHECGMKLKNGNGYCSSLGKTIYNGLCGRHYIKPKEQIIEQNLNNNFIVI